MRLGKDVIATDLYRVLGVPRTADEEQIRRAYRIQAMTSHPDLHGDDAERRMVELNVAACILLDAGRRAEYDRRRARLGGKSIRSTGDDWYPWRNTNTGADTDWTVPVSPRPPREPEVAGLRDRLASFFHAILDWSGAWPPGAHLAVTFASVCMALLLIASARPSSLPGFQEHHPIACVEGETY